MDEGTDWSGVRERVVAVVQAEHRLLPPRNWSMEPDPPLTADQIAEVEAQCGITLPDEYRSFLEQVSAGGDGPVLELLSLRRVETGWGWIWDGVDSEPWHLDASGPFIETEDWPDHQRAKLRAAGYEPADQGEDYWEAYQKAFGDVGGSIFFVHRGRGAVMISDNGCGAFSWYVVAGPHRGELRFRDCGYDPPFDPIVDAAGNRHTFRTWYLEWLERREAGLGLSG